MKTHPFGSHSPSEQRRLSDLAHRAEGLLLGAVAALSLVEGLGAGAWAGVTWRALLAAAGALLLALLYGLHPRSDWSALWRDPQQRQHTVMAALLLASGVLELLGKLGSISAAVIGWPIALLVVGWLFLSHPQHGSGDAISRATRRHRWLGATLIAAGLLRLAALVIGIAFLAIAWPAALSAAAAQLFIYREPQGAFEPGVHVHREPAKPGDHDGV